MKYRFYVTAVLSLLLVVGFFLPAEAQMIRSGVIAESPLYFDVGVGNMDLRFDDADEDATGFRAFGTRLKAGYNLSNDIAIEGHLGLFGDDDQRAIEADIGPMVAVYGRYNFGRVWDRELPENFSTYALLGLVHYTVDWDFEGHHGVDSEDSEEVSTTALGFGLGLNYAFAERLNGNFEVQGTIPREDFNYGNYNDDYYTILYTFGLSWRL